jgi:hypothetical protein
MTATIPDQAGDLRQDVERLVLARMLERRLWGRWIACRASNARPRISVGAGDATRSPPVALGGSAA